MTPFTSLSSFMHGSNTSEVEVEQWMYAIQNDVAYNVGQSSVHDIVLNEIKSQLRLLRAWRTWFEFDPYDLHLANILAKRIIYTHKPYIYPAPWKKAHKITGVNTRLVLAVDKGNSTSSTRFEAISQLPFDRLSTYYAFRVQYQMDSRGRKWQVIQPALLIAPEACRFLDDASGNEARIVARNIRLLMNMASHDYVHATMMRWFDAPSMETSAGYKQLIFENGPPPELSEWHQVLSKSNWIRLNSGEKVQVRDILEYQAAYIHHRNLEIIFECDSTCLDVIRRLVSQIDSILIRHNREYCGEVSHLGKVVIWFLLSLFPVNKLLLVLPAWDLKVLNEVMVDDVSKHLFWGFYKQLNGINEFSFCWGVTFQNIRVPFLHYADGLSHFISRQQTPPSIV